MVQNRHQNVGQKGVQAVLFVANYHLSELIQPTRPTATKYR